MTRLLVGGTDQVQLPVDSTGKRAGFVKTAIGGVGTEIYLPTTALVDDAGNTIDAAVASLASAGTERGLVVRAAGSVNVRGAAVPGQTLNVVAATPVTGTGLDASSAGNATFIVKNTIAGTAFTGNPVVMFEQSDDNVSWGPLQVTRSDNAFTSNLHTFPAGSPNASLMLDAALEGVNWVRVRVLTAPVANGMTIVTQLGGLPFSPSVSLAAAPWSTTKVLAAATTNAGFSKASAGQVGGWYIFNAAAATRFVRLFNKASAPTVGTDSPQMVLAVPAGAAANVEFSTGLNFDLGIAHAITAGIADLDATATAANDVLLNLYWR